MPSQNPRPTITRPRILALSAAAMASSLLVSQAGAAVLEFNRVVADTYHAPVNRGGIFRIVTDGVVDTTDSFRGFDTFNSNTGNPVFAGLIQIGVGAQPQTFDTVTLNLGNQFVDGGDFASPPNLYLLKNNIDTNFSLPSLDGNWAVVTGATLSQVGPNYTFTLGGAVAARTGYGFAVGGVSGSNTFRFLSVSELSATGATTRLKMGAPAKVVASVYHSPDTRAAVFTLATNGDVSPGGGFDNNRDFDTFEGAVGQTKTDFGGLLYSSIQQFDTVTLSYGTPFADGGRFAQAPRLFLNITGVDTDTTLPESDPLNWREVLNGVLDREIDGETFDLTSFPLAERLGYGWAIGGINGAGGTATPQNFISISELSASGTVPEPSSLILLGAAGLVASARRRARVSRN